MTPAQQPLSDHLSKESLILSLLSDKLAIVNYLLDQLTSDHTPQLLRNHFFIFTTHIYFRSAVIDICALLSDEKGTHKYNFHRIYQDPALSQAFNAGTLALIQQLLAAEKQSIDLFVEMRDKTLAHYDFPDNTLHFETGNVPLANGLFNVSKDILALCGQQIDTSYMIGFDHFQSLKQLVERSINH